MPEPAVATSSLVAKAASQAVDQVTPDREDKIEEVFHQAVVTNLQNGWATFVNIGNYLSRHKKLKKNYGTQTWAKYYQRFPALFEVKATNGTTRIRPKP